MLYGIWQPLIRSLMTRYVIHLFVQKIFQISMHCLL